MQAIIDSLPKRVLEYRDPRGRTIIDHDFNPFSNVISVDKISDMRPGYFITVYGEEYKDRSNIQDIIDAKIENIEPHNGNSIEDIARIIDAGHVRCIYRYFKLNLSDKHVDFVHGRINISSYYGSIPSAKSVVLCNVPQSSTISNDLITLRGQTSNVTIKSKYIHYSDHYCGPSVQYIVNNGYRSLMQLTQQQKQIDDLIERNNKLEACLKRRKIYHTNDEMIALPYLTEVIANNWKLNRVWPEVKTPIYIREYLLQTTKIV